MTPFRVILIVAALAVAALVAVGIAGVLYLASRRAVPIAPPSPGDRLYRLATERDDYLIYVAMPSGAPTRWERVKNATNEAVITESAGVILLRDIRAFLVAYPNGQLLDFEHCELELPDGIVGAIEKLRPESRLLQLADLKLGKELISVTYGPSASKSRQRYYYSTTLKNISKQKIRVLSFGGYSKTDRGWELSTISGRRFSAEEFRAWYGMGSREWLLPGESAADPHNYGGRPVLWAYDCEAEDGLRFIAGAVLE
jgi:hypothetical protein